MKMAVKRGASDLISTAETRTSFMPWFSTKRAELFAAKKMGDTNPRPSYYSQIRIDPNNDLRIWELGAPMFYSEDGGKTFSTQRVQKIHGDFHAMWIDS